MKRRVSFAAVLAAGLLAGCAMTGPGSLRVHEALLYGGTQERVVWVYGTLGGGASSAVRLGSQSVELRAQIDDPVAVPGTLSVNGKATYRLPTSAMGPRLAVTRTPAGTFDIRTSDRSVGAVYYTDGANWTKLAGLSGSVAGQPVAGLAGAGNLTEPEAGALSRALLGQGPLAVAVLAEGSLPDAPLAVEPAPQEHLRTGLYILPNVATLAATTPPTRPAPVQPVPAQPAPSPTPGARVNVTELASGTQATAQTFGVQVATTQAAAAALYAQAYGRQTGVPAAPSVGSSTIVGVFLGQRPTGGYGVKVLSASVSGSVLTLVVQLRAPAPGAITTQALTSPWTLVQVAGTYSQVRVVDERGQPLPGGAPGSGEVR